MNHVTFLKSYVTLLSRNRLTFALWKLIHKLKIIKMKSILLPIVTAIILLSCPIFTFGQSPDLGSAANFALFTSVGAVTNSGISYNTKITGNVGTNSAPTITGFGNVDGQMHYVSDPASAQCAADLLLAYNTLGAAVPDSTIGVVIGNGDTLPAGIYLMPGAASLNLNLFLDAKGDPNAVFIFKTTLAFSTSANAKVNLINGALACNVFWKLDGAVTMGSGTTFRGTIISGGSISLGTNDTLEGRALTINGAILTDQVLILVVGVQFLVAQYLQRLHQLLVMLYFLLLVL